MRLDSLLGDLGVLGLTYKGGERPIATTDKALITDYFRVSLTKGVSSPLRLGKRRQGCPTERGLTYKGGERPIATIQR